MTDLGGEVEAQAVGSDERASLVGLAQHLPQREVQHVRASVVLHHRLTTLLLGTNRTRCQLFLL